jgi:hypothetical protein
VEGGRRCMFGMATEYTSLVAQEWVCPPKAWHLTLHTHLSREWLFARLCRPCQAVCGHQLMSSVPVIASTIFFGSTFVL